MAERTNCLILNNFLIFCSGATPEPKPTAVHVHVSRCGLYCIRVCAFSARIPNMRTRLFCHVYTVCFWRESVAVSDEMMLARKQTLGFMRFMFGAHYYRNIPDMQTGWSGWSEVIEDEITIFGKVFSIFINLKKNIDIDIPSSF